MSNQSNTMITAPECAEMLGVSLPTFWRRVADGTVPRAIKIGNIGKWERSDILDVIERAKANRNKPRHDDADLEIASTIVRRYEHRFFKASGDGKKTALLAMEFACDVLKFARQLAEEEQNRRAEESAQHPKRQGMIATGFAGRRPQSLHPTDVIDADGNLWVEGK